MFGHLWPEPGAGILYQMMFKQDRFVIFVPLWQFFITIDIHPISKSQGHWIWRGTLKIFSDRLYLIKFLGAVQTAKRLTFCLVHVNMRVSQNTLE